jgi:phosphoglycerol transferase MdoB-like AlkP superfamily enzyme
LKPTILYFINIVKVWIGIFLTSKIFFLTINYKNFSEDFRELINIWWNGLRLDLSLTGYVLVLALFFLLVKRFVPKISNKLFSFYFGILFVVFAIVIASDPFFYLYWGQKANFSFIQFLGKENAGVSSIELIHYVYFIGFVAVMLFVYIKRWRLKLTPPRNIHVSLLILLMGISFLMMRGGWSIVPINVSSAFYSNNNLYNYTALNPVWNVMATEFERDKHKPISFYESEEEALDVWNRRTLYTDSLRYLIADNNNSDVLLIVLESFSAKVVGELNNQEYQVTPNLDKIMQSGISYSNAYAASFRSDKGLLALITGVPSGARQTLTNFPSEIDHQPNIFDMFDNSYNTSFYYGGNMEFANMKVLFKHADKVWSEEDFSSKITGPWGSHDEVVFEKFADDYINSPGSQFRMLFSLSSHEPFDVPMHSKFKDPYLNSISYTDSCFGVLMNRLRKSDKWDNTLVIITADHGTVRPDFEANPSPRNYHIPLLLTGGLVKKDTVITTVVSQTDIASTIAEFTGSPFSFPLQSSLFAPAGRAFYSYFDGITYVSGTSYQQYDFGQKKYLGKTSSLPLEKAYYHIANKAFFNP